MRSSPGTAAARMRRPKKSKKAFFMIEPRGIPGRTAPV
jgi:hypothetical protein